MAVVPMQKVRLLVHSSDVDAALDIVQRAGALEFRETKLENTTDIDIPFPHAQLLPRVQHAIHWLTPYAPTVGVWKKLREGTQIELTEEAVVTQLQDTDVVESVVSDLEKLQVEFAEVTEKFEELQAKYALLEEWKNLSLKLGDLATKHTITFLVKGHQATDTHTIESMLLSKLAEQACPAVVTPVSDQAAALTIANDPSAIAIARKIIGLVDGEEVTLPAGHETADVELVAVSEQLAAVKSELALLHDQAEHFAITHYRKLQVAAEILSWQRDRFAVISGAVATKYTVVFDGWLKAASRKSIEEELKNKNLSAAFSVIDPEEGEEPPVEIENKPLIRPFEAVTRLYGMPGYTDLDPTVFLAGFFFLFFGLSLTDVGYGLALVIISTIILLYFKVSQQIRQFSKLLLFVGLSTVVVGALFGGYFGISPDQLPPALQSIQQFDPIGNPLPVFYLALSLGVFQVVVGLIIKIYSEYKNGRLVAGLLDQGPWLFLFGLGILYVLQVAEYVALLSSQQIVHLTYVGILMVVLTSARHGQGVLEKVKSAAASLYGSIGFLSDILSYSRLLALGLATTALAFAVNLIAGMIYNAESFITWILAGVVLLVGHAFTLAVNTLGAFIHSARLQFVEFFGKFIVGTGREFSPLIRQEGRVQVTKEKKT